MLAAVSRSPQEVRFHLERIPIPVPKAGEALVRVIACGVCHSDLHVLKNEIDFPRPAVLGHELSGVIVALGADVHDFRIDDRVVSGFILPCTQCANCKLGRDDICEVFFQENRLKGNLLDGTSRLVDSDGSRLNMYSSAGFAEFAVVPASALARIGHDVDPVKAAILGCAGMTAYGAAVRSAGEIRDSVTSVVGVGGVGLSIVQVLSSLGARKVIAVDIDDEKLALARELGATDTVNARKIADPVDAVKRISGGGVNVAFDALGSSVTLGQVMRMLGEGGKGVAVGLSSTSAEVSIPINTFVRRGQSMQGSYGARTRADLPAVTRLAEEGKLSLSTLVSRCYSLAEINEAFSDLATGAILGRGVIVFGDAIDSPDVGKSIQIGQ